MINLTAVPPETSLVKSILSQGTVYANAYELAGSLKIRFSNNFETGQITLTSSGKKLKFTVDNHFASCGNRTFNMFYPPVIHNDEIYLPLEELTSDFDDFFAGRMCFYRNYLYYYPQNTKIVTAISRSEGSRVFIDVLTSEPLQFTYSPAENNKLSLEFIGAAGNPPSIGNMANVDSVIYKNSAGNAVVDIYVKNGLKFAAVDTLRESSGITLVFTNGSIANGSVKKNLSAVKEQWRFDTIVVDAGHGGKDPGAIGAGKTKEKTITLDIALQVGRILESKGFKVVLTRDKDVFIPLHQRGKIANQAKGKLFVSIHCNASKDRRAGGFETYFLSPARSNKALDVALLENAAVEFEDDQSFYQDLNDENYILLAMTQSHNIRLSESLCALTQDKLSEKTSLKNRGVDQAGFYVLYGANMPAILVEVAFISNRAEEKLLKTKKFRSSLAEAISESVVKFCKEAERE